MEILLSMSYFSQIHHNSNVILQKLVCFQFMNILLSLLTYLYVFKSNSNIFFENILSICFVTYINVKINVMLLILVTGQLLHLLLSVLTTYYGSKSNSKIVCKNSLLNENCIIDSSQVEYHLIDISLFTNFLVYFHQCG